MAAADEASVTPRLQGEQSSTGPYTLRPLLENAPLYADGAGQDNAITCVEYWGLWCASLSLRAGFANMYLNY